jgi:putative hydrolase of the HAD superfamily
MFESNLVGDYDLGRISSEEFGRRSMERLNVDLEMDLIQDIWSDIFHPVAGMEDLMTSLKGSYQLVLLSNTNEWHFEHCHKTFAVVRLFEHLALSYRLGCRKPDREIFEKALAMADARPEETLYIDDIPAYVESARRLGVQAICFKDRDQLTDEMRSAGIACP